MFLYRKKELARKPSIVHTVSRPQGRSSNDERRKCMNDADGSHSRVVAMSCDSRTDSEDPFPRNILHVAGFGFQEMMAG
jgi:hypothetical protein